MVPLATAGRRGPAVGESRPYRCSQTLGGDVTTIDGAYLETRKGVAGFWILEVACLEAALGLASKAAITCRALANCARSTEAWAGTSRRGTAPGQ